jgi:hypothetical protein
MNPSSGRFANAQAMDEPQRSPCRTLPSALP